MTLNKVLKTRSNSFSEFVSDSANVKAKQPVKKMPDCVQP